MTASEHTNPEQFKLFHGSRHPFEPGDMITPTSHRDGRNNYNYGEKGSVLPDWAGNYAYATEHPIKARYYAMMDKREEEPHVYEVEHAGPAKDLSPDMTDTTGGWSSSTGFKVVKKFTE